MSDNQIKVVTFATDINKYTLKNWILSVNKFNYDYTILGVGEKWKGWKHRTKSYVYFLKKMNPDKIIVLCDSYDLFFIRPEKYLKEMFLTMNSRIIFGSEEFCCTGKMNKLHNKKKLVEFCKKMAPKNNLSIYLNAGFVMGYVKDLYNLYIDVMNSDFDFDDQSAICSLWMNNPSRLTLDYDSQLVGNITIKNNRKSSIKWIVNKQGIVLRSPQNTMPTVLHFPGSSHNDFNLYDRIGLEIFSIINCNKRIVFTLSTIPQRIMNLVPTIKSLLLQNIKIHEIYINIPYYSKRFNKKYVVPEYLNKLPIKINRCKDYGPLTKLIPTLDIETDPKTLIITVDDDCEYDCNLARNLMEMMEINKNHAISYSGLIANHKKRKWDYGKDEDKVRVVDVIQGYTGSIFRRNFFHNLEEFKNIKCFTNDDVWISCYLRSKGVVLLSMPRMISKLNDNDTIQPLRSINNPGKVSKEYKCFEKLCKIFDLKPVVKKKEISNFLIPFQTSKYTNKKKRIFIIIIVILFIILFVVIGLTLLITNKLH